MITGSFMLFLFFMLFPFQLFSHSPDRTIPVKRITAASSSPPGR